MSIIPFSINKKWLWLTGILIVTVFAYFPVFENNFTNWDDNIFVTENKLINSFSLNNLIRWFTKPFVGQYQPFILLSFALDYSIDGLNPFVFHTTNLILHLINTFLVFRFLDLLFKNPFIALLSSFLFGIHTLHVESVAWITERKNVLYALFFLSSLIAYLFYLRKKKSSYYFLSLFFFILSLMSKAAAVTLPLALILVDYIYKRHIFGKGILLEKIPFFVLSIILGLATIYAHHQYGALANSTGYPFYIRILVTGEAIIFYITKILMPLNLSAYYPMLQNLSEHLTPLILIFLLSYLVLFSAIILSFYKKLNVVFFGFIFFLINIFLFLIPAGVPVYATDRYAYIPSIGLFVIISYGIYHLFKKYPKIKTAGLVFISLYILLLSVLTFQQTKVWNNSLTLWDNVINTTGKTYFPLLKRGIAYREEQNYKAALSDLNESIRLNHNNYYAYENRGFIYLVQKKYNTAIDDFRSSLEFNPESSYAYCSLGFALLHLDNYKEAMENLNKALAIYHGYADAYKNRGEVYICMENYEEACNDLKQALSLGLAKSDTEEVKTLVKEYCGGE